MSPVRPDGGWQPVRRFAPQVDGGLAACTLGAAGLLVCLFALRWFGAVGPSQGLERTGRPLALGGWESLGALRWVLVVLATGGLVAGTLGRRVLRARSAPALTLLALAAIAGLLSGYRILIDPPQPGRIVDVKLGGYTALLCAAAIAVGAADAVRRTGGRRSGWGIN